MLEEVAWPIPPGQSSTAAEHLEPASMTARSRADFAPNLTSTAAMAAAALFGLLVVIVAAFGGYKLTEVDEPSLGPSASHWLGTNVMGEDVLGLVAAGGRQLALPLVVAVASASLIGGCIGPWAAVFAGSWLDRLLQLIVEVAESVPKVIIILAVIAYMDYEHYVWKLYMTIAAAFVPTVYRATRSEALRLRLSAFVESAATLGVPWRRIVAVHIVRNHVLPLVAVHSVALAGYVLLFDAILGFVGVRQYGEVFTWGNLLGTGWQEWTEYASAGLPYNPWSFWAPLGAVWICVITSVVAAEALRRLTATAR